MAPKTTQWVFHAYRHRFGIETHYRPLGKACIKTTPHHLTQRWLFVGIALLLRNVWVFVHGVYLATPRRGGRQLNWHTLRFETLLMWLRIGRRRLSDSMIQWSLRGHLDDEVNLELLSVIIHGGRTSGRVFIQRCEQALAAPDSDGAQGATLTQVASREKVPASAGVASLGSAAGWS